MIGDTTSASRAKCAHRARGEADRTGAWRQRVPVLRCCEDYDNYNASCLVSRSVAEE